MSDRDREAALADGRGVHAALARSERLQEDVRALVMERDSQLMAALGDAEAAQSRERDAQRALSGRRDEIAHLTGQLAEQPDVEEELREDAGGQDGRAGRRAARHAGGAGTRRRAGGAAVAAQRGGGRDCRSCWRRSRPPSRPRSRRRRQRAATAQTALAASRREVQAQAAQQTDAVQAAVRERDAATAEAAGVRGALSAEVALLETLAREKDTDLRAARQALLEAEDASRASHAALSGQVASLQQEVQALRAELASAQVRRHCLHPVGGNGSAGHRSPHAFAVAVQPSTSNCAGKFCMAAKQTSLLAQWRLCEALV